MVNSKPVSTLLDPGTKLANPDSFLKEELEEPKAWQDQNT